MLTVFLLVNCAGGYEKQVEKDLKDLLVEVCNTFGMFDFICKIQENDVDAIEQKIWNIRRIHHITYTNTIYTIPEQE